MKKVTPSLLAMAAKKPEAASAAPKGRPTIGFRPSSLMSGPAKAAAAAKEEADREEDTTEDASPAGDDRQRVVVRLNIEALEAIEEIKRDLRRVSKRSVSFQKLMEEAVADLLRKYEKAAVVLPATSKRGR